MAHARVLEIRAARACAEISRRVLPRRSVKGGATRSNSPCHRIHDFLALVFSSASPTSSPADRPPTRPQAAAQTTRAVARATRAVVRTTRVVVRTTQPAAPRAAGWSRPGAPGRPARALGELQESQPTAAQIPVKSIRPRVPSAWRPQPHETSSAKCCASPQPMSRRR